MKEWKHIKLYEANKKDFLPLLSFIVLLLGFSACESEISWPLDHSLENTVVVDARITNEFKTQRIDLSLPISHMNDTPAPLSGATVSVSAGNQSVQFLESEQVPGRYFSQQPFAAAVNVNYHLSIEKNELSFEAQTYMVPVLPYDRPRFVFHPDKRMFKLRWNNNKYSPFEQAMYQADISWSHLPQYNHPDSVTRARL
ncbi:MAG: DUF4249 family protein, partial [Bacteroidota bacterium]